MPRPICFLKRLCLKPSSSFHGTIGKKQCIVALGFWWSEERRKAASTYEQMHFFATVPFWLVSKD